MRRQVSIKSSPDQSLHPALQAGLSCLDVDLEEELARYRRNRRLSVDQISRLQRVASPAKPRSAPKPAMPVAPPAAFFPEDPAVTPASEGIPPMAIAADAPPINAKASSMATETVSAIVPATSFAAAGTSNDSDDSEEFLASSEELLRSVEAEEELRASQEPGILESVLTPLGIGSLLLLLLSSLTFGYLMMNPDSLNRLTFGRPSGSSAPSPSAPASTTQQADEPAPNLANQEFVDLNLETLPNLPQSGENQAPTSSVAAPTAPPPVTPAQPAAPIELAPIEAEDSAPTVEVEPSEPPQTAPRRAARQREEARQSEETDRPSRRPAVRRSPAAPSPSRTERRPAAPSPDRASTPANRQSSPAQSATATARPANPSTATSPQASGSPASRRMYRVETNFSGDSSLEQVRQVVGDAYVRNNPDGARVQAGAFTDETRARELVRQLEQQGIPAQIRETEN